MAIIAGQTLPNLFLGFLLTKLCGAFVETDRYRKAELEIAEVLKLERQLEEQVLRYHESVYYY